MQNLLKSMTSLELEEWKAYFITEGDDNQGEELAARAERGLAERKANMVRRR